MTPPAAASSSAIAARRSGGQSSAIEPPPPAPQAFPPQARQFERPLEQVFDAPASRSRAPGGAGSPTRAASAPRPAAGRPRRAPPAAPPQPRRCRRTARRDRAARRQGGGGPPASSCRPRSGCARVDDQQAVTEALEVHGQPPDHLRRPPAGRSPARRRAAPDSGPERRSAGPSAALRGRGPARRIPRRRSRPAEPFSAAAISATTMAELAPRPPPRGESLARVTSIGGRSRASATTPTSASPAERRGRRASAASIRVSPWRTR